MLSSSLGHSLIPVQEMMQVALSEDLPSWIDVLGDLNENTVDDLPGVLHYESITGSPGNRLGVYDVTVTLSTLALSGERAWETANEVYRTLRSWQTTRFIDGLGGLRWMNNISLFSRIEGQSKMTIGKPVEQFTGLFLIRAFELPYFS